MIQDYYAIKDSKPNEFKFLFTAPTSVAHEAAKRMFTSMVKGTEDMQQFPNDYELWYIGKMDTQDGTFTQPKKIEYLTNAAESMDILRKSECIVNTMEYLKVIEELKEQRKHIQKLEKELIELKTEETEND